MLTNTIQEKIADVAERAHIKWLEKAKTATINGSELTVLPYGYLQRAIQEAGMEIYNLGKQEAKEEAVEYIRKAVSVPYMRPQEAIFAEALLEHPSETVEGEDVMKESV